MKTFKLLSIIGIVAITFSSCQKGDTGPAGANGTNGVANISTNIYSITPGSWSAVSGGYGVNISDASIASANTDGIEVFISQTSGQWIGLPLSDFLTSGDEMLYVYQNGSIALGYSYTSAPTATLGLKVVVIPPAVMKQHPNTNWHDYNQVKAIMDVQNTNSK